ncbi:ethanolamine ammonia-lyase subunit EutC [Lysinibacillus endophyticus]|uniref:ethanolamine ammonia-lyase subunit EutC n=1 Tax=Ureibacillus endophyticus TaxID=1978490 RepID=UPI00209FC494|nr:ethanolamine ammonia-lyase subunit EutC [Lysinibacillus endophyticus]MCP1146662.1 ethanolamine ammonia-lyase subunit EutC [Lysinibacillus endophyticus]
MDAKTIEQITKMVIETLSEQTQRNERPLISIRNPSELLQETNPLLKNDGIPIQDITPKEFSEDFDERYANARRKTPARIGIGRSGPRPLTKSLLKFRLDHAAAVDSVYGEVDTALLEKLGFFTIQTKVENDKETYILRPDLGRKLNEHAKEVLINRCIMQPQVQIIASNGLSAKAINANLENVYLSLVQSLESLQLTIGTPFYIEQGRVGLMDDIGELLKPTVVIYLIGERPGLVTAESMSAYICYQPRHGTIESDRTVVSNIHQGGIPPVEAGAFLGTLIEKILKYEASGIKLVEKEG